MVQAQKTFNTELVFAGLLCLLALSLAFVWILAFIEKMMTPWRQEVHF
jgi:ABC-type nitrate/sulfonate/bicarbonate transport system permease component